MQEVSFFAWPAYALQHGINPFYTVWVNYPAGVNFTVNTAFILLGILAIPITLTAGPIASFDIFLILSFALSALAMCLVLRRWVAWWPAAFVGGLLYGFSPFMIGEGTGHLFLTFVPILPLVLLVLDEIFVRQTRSPWKYGLLLGFLAAAQYYVSDEILAITAVVAVLGVVLLAITHPRIAVGTWRHAFKSLLIAVPLCAVLIAYPVWFSLSGPAHTAIPHVSFQHFEKYTGDLLGGIVPTTFQVFGPSSLKTVGNRFTSRDVGENGLYLGVPLVLALLCIVALCRRVRGVVFFSVMLVLTYLLSLGPRLHIDTHDTGVPLPFALLMHLPILNEILGVRFSVFVQFFAAIVFAIGVDRLYAWLRDSQVLQRIHMPANRTSRRLLAVFATGCVVIVSLVALTPRIPYSAARITIPDLFSSSAIKEIPAGSVLLSYPYPTNPEDQILIPQSESDMRFKIIGGPGHTPTSAAFGPAVLDPRTVDILFNAAFYNPRDLPDLPEVITPATVADLRTFLVRYNVDTIVLYPVGRDPGIVRQYVTALLGQPQWSRGVVAWFDVAAKLVRVKR